MGAVKLNQRNLGTCKSSNHCWNQLYWSHVKLWQHGNASTPPVFFM